MKKELRDYWIETLREGRFSQGRSKLHFVEADNDERRNDGLPPAPVGYCCLGVLSCLIAEDPGTSDFDRDWTWDGFSWIYQPWDSESTNFEESHYLPDEVRNQIGFEKDAANALAKMNDTGSTFKTIADWIEENVQVDAEPPAEF